MKKLVFLFALLISTSLCVAQFASKSNLADGTIYRIEIPETGVYKISHSFLVSNGVSLSGVNPNQVQVLAQPGGMLAQANDNARTDDLASLPIWVSGGSDGSFDAGDYIVFYAQGANSWAYDDATDLLQHQQNVYAQLNYVFIKISRDTHTAISNQPSATGIATEITAFDDLAFIEPEKFNPLLSGRDWYGSEYRFNLSETFKFTMEGILPASDIKLKAQVMSNSTVTSSFNFSMNGSSLGIITGGITPQTTYGIKGIENTETFSVLANGLNTDGGISIDLSYNQGNSSSRGYLDYLLLNAQRSLKLYGAQTNFRSIASISNSVSLFRLGNSSTETQIWDVTNPLEPKRQDVTLSGETASFQIETERVLKEFVAFNPSALPVPNSLQAVANQDLHGLTTPDLLIVTHSDFFSEANRLAQFRRNNDGLTVAVVSTQQVYNEFASGRADVSAIRDFARMLYLRQPNTLKYLLLFGDGSYAYKSQIDNNTNFVPIYESRNTLHPLLTYSSDDYFGFMEATEGEWVESGSSASLNSHTLDLGVGRLPAQTQSEAKAMVDKLIRYASEPATLGAWRQKVFLAADDGDINTHQRDADRLASIIEDDYRLFNPEKAFVDAYPQTTQGIIKTSEIVREKVKEAYEEGSLVLNFTGHGNELGWTSENILDVFLIENLSNQNTMPLLVTATCEFGRYDDPARNSGAEIAIKKANGGAIGMLTTTRPVLSFSNYRINRAFYQSVFEHISGEMPRLGDVIRLTKNGAIDGTNNRNFSLLGDPSMTLAYPKDDVVVTKITDSSGSTSNTISALDKITVEGEIRNNGVLENTFNGVLDAMVFEKPTKITTLGDDGPTMTFYNQESKLFTGKATVKDGKFSFTFIVPKDIDYQLGMGKISLYAQHNTQFWDAGGYADLTVGGSSANPVIDSDAPTATLHLENNAFQSGDLVSRQPLILANLSDVSGFNLTGLGLGHDLSISIDDGEFFYVLNDEFQPVIDDITKGTVSFRVPDVLSPGRHTAKLSVFDVNNNGLEVEVEFIINGDLLVESVLAYPNPMGNETTFRFRHNRGGDRLDVVLEVFELSGRLVNSYHLNVFNAPSEMDLFTWGGTNQAGQPLANGLYIYKLNITSRADGATTSETGRVVINR